MIATFLVLNPTFWPYLAAVALLAAGSAAIVQGRVSPAAGVEKSWRLGPLFLAVPMGVFGADHFVASKSIAQIVPAWMPWHLFWVYFVGTALIAAALSIVSHRHSALAATLLGGMLLSFVFLIHIPTVIEQPDRFAVAILFRDLSFSAGAFALAMERAHRLSPGRARSLASLLRYALAVPTLIFGVEHYLHPGFAPVIPLKQPLPSWIPAQAPLAYITGSVLLVASACLLIDWRSRQVATWLGAFVFAIVMLVYLPLLVANPFDIVPVNYFFDTLAFAGSALLLADLLRKTEEARADATAHAGMSGAQAGLGY